LGVPWINAVVALKTLSIGAVGWIAPAPILF
jgi:hypothetical protein